MTVGSNKAQYMQVHQMHIISQQTFRCIVTWTTIGHKESLGKKCQMHDLSSLIANLISLTHFSSYLQEQLKLKHHDYKDWLDQEKENGARDTGCVVKLSNSPKNTVKNVFIIIITLFYYNHPHTHSIIIFVLVCYWQCNTNTVLGFHQYALAPLYYWATY